MRVRYTTSNDGGEDVQNLYFSAEFEFEDVGRDDTSTIVYILNNVEPRIMTLREVEGSIEVPEIKREHRQEVARLVKLHVEDGKTVSEVSDDLLISEESVRQLLKEATNG